MKIIISELSSKVHLVLTSLVTPTSTGRANRWGTRLVSQGSWVRYRVWENTFVSTSAFSRRAVVTYWRKYVHKVLVNRLGGLSLPLKSVVRLTDSPDMTLDVYHGRKTTIQQQQQHKYWLNSLSTRDKSS